MASHPSLHESGMRCNKFDTVFLFTAFLEKLELIWNFLLFLLFHSRNIGRAKKKNYEKLWTRHWAWALKIARMAYARLLNFTIMRMASWSERHDRREKCTADEVVRKDKRKLALTRQNREIRETIGRDIGERSLFLKMTLLEASFLLPPSAAREW